MVDHNLAARVMLDQKDRVISAIDMFRPTEQQEEFIREFSRDWGLEFLVGGGNRCLAGCQEIYDPVTKTHTRVDSIHGDFHVWSRDPRTGRRIISKASKPFIKGYEDFYEVFLSNGQSMIVTAQHRWLAADGSWCSAQDQMRSFDSSPEHVRTPLASTSGTFLSGFPRDDLRCRRTTQDCPADCRSSHRFCDAQPLRQEGIGAPFLPLRADVQECIHSSCRMDDWGHTQGCSRHRLETDHPSTADARFPTLARLADAVFLQPSSPCSQSFAARQSDQRFAEWSARTHTFSRSQEDAWQDGFAGPGPQETSGALPQSRRKALLTGKSPEFEDPCGRVLQPNVEHCEASFISSGVNVIGYAWHSRGDVWDFEVPETGNYECAGIVSHNSGKSVVVTICIAAGALNRPITFRDGTKVHMRPERWRSEALKIWLVGYDHRHIGKTLYRLLFMPNLFRIVLDPLTKRWRSYDPTRSDEVSFDKTRPSPPVIRYADLVGGESGISWENKKEHQIASCTLKHDGTRMEFFASTGAKPQGDPAHLIWMDEKIADERWYSELQARLWDHRGKMVWTSWPDVSPCATIAALEKRAIDMKGDPKCRSFAFTFKGSANPYIVSELRTYSLSTMDEDTARARDEGAVNMEKWRVYPRFSRFVHRAMAPDDTRGNEGDDALAKIVRAVNGIPADWTRYLILDPGTANPAVLFVAVPPPNLGNFIVPYDELYPHYSDAERVATLVKAKTSGQYFEDFIADAHACRQQPMGFSGTVEQNYSKHFAEKGLRCRRRGSHFSYGSDDVDTRIMVLQNAMMIKSNGMPKLRVLGCPILCSQLESYRWGEDPKRNPTDKPSKYQKIDLAQCLEYFTSRDDCGYVKPPLSRPDDLRDPKFVAGAIAKAMGIGRKPQSADTVYCGSGVPSRW